MKTITIILALLCAGCIERKAEKQLDALPESYIERGDNGMQQIGSWIYRDTKTGCEWITFGEPITPRIDATGKQVCGVKP